MGRTLILSTLAAILTVFTARSADAQMAPPPMGTTGPTETGSLGGGGGPARGIGVGMTAMLFDAPGGIQVAYDTGAFHVEGIVGIVDPPGRTDTRLALGGRFWWHMHSSSAADFSIGGGLGYRHFNDVSDDANDQLNIEAGAHIRAFLVPSVALSGTLGLSVMTLDYDGFLLGAGLFGGLGLTYYFN